MKRRYEAVSLGQPFHNDRIQFNVTQAYDFTKNNVYQFGAQAFNGNVAVRSAACPTVSRCG